jgi:hypothetical protein
MATIFEATRQIIENRFFYGEDGIGTKNTFTFDFFVEGRQFKQPTNKSWVVVSVMDAGSAMTGFYVDHRKTSGTARFKIFVKHGQGTKGVRTIADTINQIMSYTAGDSNTNHGGTLSIGAGSLRKISDDDNGFLSYVLDFPYDYYTS